MVGRSHEPLVMALKNWLASLRHPRLCEHIAAINSRLIEMAISIWHDDDFLCTVFEQLNDKYDIALIQEGAEHKGISKRLW